MYEKKASSVDIHDVVFFQVETVQFIPDTFKCKNFVNFVFLDKTHVFF